MSSAAVVIGALRVNTFIPRFLKNTLPSLNLDMSTEVNRGLSLRTKTELQAV